MIYPLIQLAAVQEAPSYNVTYLIVFVGIAILSYIIQANLKNKFKKMIVMKSCLI